ncbi:MAG: hypothetical protein WC919_04380 [Candidatus Paceibacterota bacterium]|jgi:hypothetical protein
MARTASQVGKSNVSTAKNHERRVAKLLSEWSGREFRRRRVEGRESDTVLRDLTGDVVPADAKNRCRFNLEAKKGKGFSFNSILSGFTTCKFSEWYHQSTFDAILVSKALQMPIMPMVFFKPHPNFDWVAFSVGALDFLRPKDSNEKQERLWFPHLFFDHYGYCGEISFNISHTKNRKNVVIVPLQLSPCLICTWNDFAANVNPDSFFFGESWHVVDVATESRLELQGQASLQS